MSPYRFLPPNCYFNSSRSFTRGWKTKILPELTVMTFMVSLPAPSNILLYCTIVIYQVLAMSSRSWLSYWYQSRFHLTPLSYETLEYASGFASEQCPEGIVAISTNTLRSVASFLLSPFHRFFSSQETSLKGQVASISSKSATNFFFDHKQQMAEVSRLKMFVDNPPSKAGGGLLTMLAMW